MLSSMRRYFNRSDYSARSRRLSAIAAIGLLALLIRLAPLMRAGDFWTIESFDSTEYVQLAHGLQSGCGFARLEDGKCWPPERMRTPGYPLFIAAMPSLRWAVACQALLGAATCVLIGWFALLSFSFAAALTAETLLALDVASIAAGSAILSDVLFQSLMTAGVVLGLLMMKRAVADRRAVAMGILGALFLGAAALVRPIAIMAPLFAAAPFLACRIGPAGKRLSLALCAGLIPALVMMGWAGRNYRETGDFTLSTDGAKVLYFFDAAGVLWYRHPERPLPEIDTELARYVGASMSQKEIPSPEARTAMLHRSIEIFRADPAATVLIGARLLVWLSIVPLRGDLAYLLGVKGGPRAWRPGGAMVSERIAEVSQSAPLLALVVFQLAQIAVIWIGVALALSALFRKSGRELWVTLIPLGVAMVLLMAAAKFELTARYRVPAIPLLAMVSGLGWSALIPRKRWPHSFSSPHSWGDYRGVGRL